MIEAAYHEYIKLISEAYGNKFKQTKKGEQLQKKTWLASAAYHWTELRRTRLIDSDDGRVSKLKAIDGEINSKEPPKIVVMFHRAFFSDSPIVAVDHTWKYSGRMMLKIAIPVLEMPPGQSRQDRCNEITREIQRLETLWMFPLKDPTVN
jgi:hypothetical protein